MKTGESIKMKATRSIRGFQKVSWNELYDTEQEMINDMCRIDYTKYYIHSMLRGYEYLGSFKKYYLKNGFLTSKQIVQLKRLASSLYYFLYVVNK